MKSCSSFLLFLTCLWACESTPRESIIRHDSKRHQKSISVDSAGDLALDSPEEMGVAKDGSLLDGGEILGTNFHSVSVDTARTNKSGYFSSTTFCYQNDSASFGNCWAQKPPTSTPACTVSSGAAVCKCPDPMCDIDQLASSNTTGRCAQKKIYVADGKIHSNNSDLDVTGTAEEVFCENMVNNNQWSQQGCIKTNADGPESYSKKWWKRCDSGYTSSGWTKCLRKDRFIQPKESCWDSFFGGKCKNHDKNYDEYATSCYKGQCVPYAFAQNREPCKCSWTGWNFLVACSAQGGACGGHACVLNTGDGNKYCDYATEQNWHSLLH